jgi:S-ribosylhomocysteine lyase LuxS involved in autoinducer biosynthesis
MSDLSKFKLRKNSVISFNYKGHGNRFVRVKELKNGPSGDFISVFDIRKGGIRSFTLSKISRVTVHKQ